MEHWLKVLRKNYGIADKFNHKTVVNNMPKNFLRTLEIGAGIGEHLNYERLNDNQKKNYYAMDIRENLLKIISQEHPKINTILGDCEKKIDFEKTENFEFKDDNKETSSIFNNINNFQNRTKISEPISYNYSLVKNNFNSFIKSFLLFFVDLVCFEIRLPALTGMLPLLF